MKAYRKFKLPESVWPPAKVANPAKVRTPEPEALATLATLAAGKAAPDPDEVEIEERKAMAMGGVPEAYLDAWAHLQVRKPMQVSDERWRQAINDAGRFLDAWGALAAGFQWAPADLFDGPRADGTSGLVWTLNGRRVSSIGPEFAGLGNGAQVFDRLMSREVISPPGASR